MLLITSVALDVLKELALESVDEDVTGMVVVDSELCACVSVMVDATREADVEEKSLYFHVP